MGVPTGAAVAVAVEVGTGEGGPGRFWAQLASRTSAARSKLPPRSETEFFFTASLLASQGFLETNGKNTFFGTSRYGAENSEVLPEVSIDVAVRLGPVSGPPK